MKLKLHTFLNTLLVGITADKGQLPTDNLTASVSTEEQIVEHYFQGAFYSCNSDYLMFYLFVFTHNSE